MDRLAQLDLVGIRADGSEVPVVLSVGAPVHTDDQWSCTVSMSGIDPTTVDVGGGDALQALCLAVRFMELRVTDFTRKGGKLYYSDGGPDVPESDFPVEAYFGALQ